MSDALETVKPTIPAADWHADPTGALQRTADFIASIPASHAWATWSAVGLGALLVLQRAGPLIPYVGPFIGAAMERFPMLQPLINAAWGLASHANEVQADRAKTVVAASAGDLLPIAQAANSKPELIAALKALAGG